VSGRTLQYQGLLNKVPDLWFLGTIQTALRYEASRSESARRENACDTFARLVEGFCEIVFETKDPTSGQFLLRNSVYDEYLSDEDNKVDETIGIGS
jgi:hypothetical protein